MVCLWLRLVACRRHANKLATSNKFLIYDTFIMTAGQLGRSEQQQQQQQQVCCRVCYALPFAVRCCCCCYSSSCCRFLVSCLFGCGLAFSEWDLSAIRWRIWHFNELPWGRVCRSRRCSRAEFININVGQANCVFFLLWQNWAMRTLTCARHKCHLSRVICNLLIIAF